MSRVLLIRFGGIGRSPYTEASTFCTSTPPGYVTDPVEGVLSVPTGFSSSVTPFQNVGSDPSCALSFANTPEIRGRLLAGRIVPYVTSGGEWVRTTGYLPAYRPYTIGVTDASPFAINDYVTIAGERLLVTAVGASDITVDTIFDSVPVPKPWSMPAESVGGTPIFSSTPVIDGAFCEVSAVDPDAISSASEEVLFRGFVRDWSMDTSAGATGAIRVSVGGLMSALSTRSLAPPPMRWFGAPPQYNDAAAVYESTMRFGSYYYNADTYGAAADVAPVGNTAPPFLYWIPREGAMQNIWSLWQVGNSRTEVAGGVPRTVCELGTDTGTEGRPVTFGIGFRSSQGAYLADNGAQIGNLDGPRYANYIDNMRLDPAVLFGWQPAHVGYTYASAVMAVLTGKTDISPDAEYPATMAGFLTDSWIDESSLAAFAEFAVTNAIFGKVGGVTIYALPPVSADGKTLIDYLVETVLAPNAGCLVQDGGVLRFVAWVGTAAFPRPLTSASLGAPSAVIASSRASLLKQVNITVGSSVGIVWDTSVSVTPEVTDVVLSDFCAGATGGKTISIADNSQTDIVPWTVTDNGYASGLAVSDSAVALATNLVGMWGLPAPMLTITLSDRLAQLALGDDVAITLDQVVGSDGNMGISRCRGIVLESTRYWRDRATSYKIALVGYAAGAAKPAYWAACAEVTATGAGTLTVDANRFTPLDPTPSPSQLWGTPNTDADAFWQSSKAAGEDVYLMLLDSNGLPLPSATPPILDADATGGTTITYRGSFAPAVPAAGMVVALAPYASQSNPDALLDAFLADSAGEVAGNPPWTWQVG